MNDDDLICAVCKGPAKAYRIGAKHGLVRCVAKDGKYRGCGMRFEPVDLTAEEAIEFYRQKTGENPT